MELTINLMTSESSAGSEKAKKMGLVSAGFGRYRSKAGGPITHKVVGGKLTKAKVQGTAKTDNLFCIKGLEFFAADDLDDIKDFIGPKLKVSKYKYQGTNGNPEATIVGQKAELEKMLRKFVKGSGDEDIARYDIVAYGSKKDASKKPLHKKDKKALNRLDELQDEIKDLRKQLIREYEDDLDGDEYDDDDADQYVIEDDKMKDLLTEQYKLEKGLKLNK